MRNLFLDESRGHAECVGTGHPLPFEGQCRSLAMFAMRIESRLFRTPGRENPTYISIAEPGPNLEQENDGGSCSKPAMCFKLHPRWNVGPYGMRHVQKKAVMS